jgi:hypothetical protein
MNRLRTLPEGTGGDDLVVFIPQDKRGGSRVKRIERAVRWLWSRGIYPGPAAVSLRLHGHATRTINGVETMARNRLLIELGISRQRRHALAPWEPHE